MLYSTESCYFYFLGSLFMYEEGIAYYHQHHGIIVLPKPEFAALHLYDGVSRTIIPSIFSNNLRCKSLMCCCYLLQDSPSAVLMLLVTYKEVMCDFLPLHLRTQCNRLIFAMWPKSKAYKVFFKDVPALFLKPFKFQVYF